MKKAVAWLLQVLGLAGIVLFSVFPFSCRYSPEGVEIVGSEYSSPVIEDVEVLSDESMEIKFSDRVELNGIVVTEVNEKTDDETGDETGEEDDENLSGSNENSGGTVSDLLEDACDNAGTVKTEVNLSEDGKEVTVNFVTPTEVGKDYELYGEVEDKTGSTLTFTVGFKGYNSNVPVLLFSEIRTAKKTQSDKDKRMGIVKTEAVELLVAKGGNLTGLVMKSGYDGAKKDFVFPSVEVKTGDVIVVHPRWVESDAVNEYGTDLDLSGGVFSFDGVRDLWGETTDAHYGDKTDVLLIVNSADNSVIDAVMYADSNETEWKKELQAEYALMAKAQGFFETSEITGAIDASTVTSTKSIFRKGLLDLSQRLQSGEELTDVIPFCPADWDVSGSSEETIGILN